MWVRGGACLETQVMGIIIFVILVLLGISYVVTGNPEASNTEWQPQSQLEMSQRQSDLYDELNLNNRPMGRRLPPGAPGDDTGVPSPSHSPGKVRVVYLSVLDFLSATTYEII